MPRETGGCNRKANESSKHPDRNAQFEYINAKVVAAQAQQQPVISVDTKKKELIGNFKNPGRCWRRDSRDVLDHDYPSWASGRGIPYGLFDLGQNAGYVVVGTSHDTPDFAVATIRRWWRAVGRRLYPARRRLLIEADAGGANGCRRWGWKVALQGLADEFGLIITVTHYPPGASKWNPVEHRLFGPISENWAGEPLVSYETMLKYIRTTSSATGLHCRACLDTRCYPTKVKISKEQKRAVRLKPRKVLPKWNYTIWPHHLAPK